MIFRKIQERKLRAEDVNLILTYLLMSEQLKKPPSFMERFEKINNTLGEGTCDFASTRVCLNLVR